jgi:hypothetical protein
MSSSSPTPHVTSSHSHIRRIFLGNSGLRSGWRFAIFLIIFLVSVLLSARLLGYFVPQVHVWATSQLYDSIQPGFTLFERSWELAFLFIATFVMSRIEKRSLFSYGLPWRGALGRKFWFGSAIGLCGASVLMLLIATFGGYSFGPLELGLGSTLKYALVWAVVFYVGGGLLEEFLFRGYTLTTLAEAIGFWPAATVLSFLFAAVHLSSPGERWPGLLAVFCFGLLAALTLRITGDLWFVIGLHTAWDWAHVFLFSVPIAGMTGPGRLMHAELHGPQWLTGGTVGPDGSIFVFLVLLGIAVLVWRLPFAWLALKPCP